MFLLLSFTAAEFDPARHLDTHPALLHRTYNRPTTSMLESQQFPGINAEEMDEELKVSNMAITCTLHYTSHGPHMLITCTLVGVTCHPHMVLTC